MIQGHIQNVSVPIRLLSDVLLAVTRIKINDQNAEINRFNYTNIFLIYKKNYRFEPWDSVANCVANATLS